MFSILTCAFKISRTQTIDPESTGPPLFGSLMPYVLMARKPGVPVIALRKDEKHYSNIQTVTKSSLTVRKPSVSEFSTHFIIDRSFL